MIHIERSIPIFRGVYERSLRERLIVLLRDAFDLLLYKNLSSQSQPQTFDQTYTDNKVFWKDALAGRQFQSMRVRLENFHLTEWLPSAPGRYYLKQSEEKRKQAQKYIAETGRRQEYLPLGKQYMWLGGIGSVRLGAKIIDSKSIYFLCASSTGISHQGIPVALTESQYRQVIQTIKEHGGCLVNLVGSLRLIDYSQSIIRHVRGIPKYCLFTESVSVIRPSLEKELLTTVAITFASERTYPHKEFTKAGYTTILDCKHWSFCSFQGSAERKLHTAVDWLKDYASRYSFMTDPPILNDFDETCEHFDNPVEFSIERLFNNDFDIDLLKAYQGLYGFTINIKELHMGDVFENISDSTIVNRSVVEKSFGKIQTEFDEETAKALLLVAEEIAKSGNKEAAELFTGFNEELQKSNPRKNILNKLWDGIIAVLPGLSQLADVCLKISKLFSP